MSPPPPTGAIVTPCPPWCHGEHELTHDHQIAYRSDGVIVPGVKRVTRVGDRSSFPTVVEISIGLEHVGDETWVWFGSDDPSRPSTILSLETTKRLIRAVTALLPETP